MDKEYLLGFMESLHPRYKGRLVDPPRYRRYKPPAKYSDEQYKNTMELTRKLYLRENNDYSIVEGMLRNFGRKVKFVSIVS